MDHDEAFKWYQLSANQGYKDAQYNLGVLLTNGHGVPMDHESAFKWFKLAAEAGHEQAMKLTCEAYILGRGIPVDRVQALIWACNLEVAKRG